MDLCWDGGVTSLCECYNQIPDMFWENVLLWKHRHPFLQGSERSDVLLLYKVTLSLCVCHCSISGCTEVVLAVWMNWWCSVMVARALVLISSLTEWLLFASSAAYITAINPSRLIVMVIVWAVSDGYYPWPGCWCFMALRCSFISLYLFHTLSLSFSPSSHGLLVLVSLFQFNSA